MAIVICFFSCKPTEIETTSEEKAEALSAGVNRLVKSLEEDIFQNKMVLELSNHQKNEPDYLLEFQKVDTRSVLRELFDPNAFDCGLKQKMKEKILRRMSDQNAFPNQAFNKAIYRDSAWLIPGFGANVLANSIRYQQVDGTTSKMLFVDTAPTANNFDATTFLENRPAAANTFLYSLDCSGYFSSSLSVAVGLRKNIIKASAEAAAKTNGSIAIVGGVMYSPIYSAYEGSSLFSGNDAETKALRIKTLESILTTLPNNLADETQLILHKEFLVLFTSNDGGSSFNGQAQAGASGNFSFGVVNVSGAGQVGGKVSRTVSYASHKTYIMDVDVFSEPDEISIGTIKDLIQGLKITDDAPNT